MPAIVLPIVGDLSPETFRTVIDSTPLASIDLLVTDSAGRLLVGKRKNEPAKGYYFVPGGRIRKGETNEAALGRIAVAELGLRDVHWNPSNVAGVFDHHYGTNALEEPGLSTHYVVIAYRIEPEQVLDLPTEQHSDYRWITRADLSGTELVSVVHENTALYLSLLDPPMSEAQYRLVNARRDAANALVWQTPVLGLTGLAFLFLVLLAGDTSREGRWISAALAMAVSAAAFQLTSRHREHEVQLTEMAQNHERALGIYPLNRRLEWSGPLRSVSSVKVWTAIFVITFVAALLAAIIVPDAPAL